MDKATAAKTASEVCVSRKLENTLKFTINLFINNKISFCNSAKID